MKRKHLLIMLACCLPALGLLVAYLLGAPLGNMGFLALVVLCPLLHIFMMRGMGHEHGPPTKAEEEVSPKQKRLI